MKLLVIRTIQVDLLVRLIENLRSRQPDVRISVLTNPQQYDRVEGLDQVDKVFVTRLFRNYSMTNIGFRTVRAIWNDSFDSVIIPHKQAGIHGFGNVLLMLPFLRIANWYHCSTDWKLIKVSKFSPIVLVTKSLLLSIFFIPLALLSYIGFLYVLLIQKRFQKKISNEKRWYAGFGDI